jgi:hypothetical protein
MISRDPLPWWVNLIPFPASIIGEIAGFMFGGEEPLAVVLGIVGGLGSGFLVLAVVRTAAWRHQQRMEEDGPGRA